MSEKISFLAAIELGSHEVILKIAQVTSDKVISEIESISRTINLGSDSYRLGYTTNVNINLLLEILKDFKKRIAVYPDIKLTIASTSAIRESANSMFVLDQIYNQTGFEVEVLSNREELAGMLRAIRFKMSHFDKVIQEPTLLLDIGAGSTQLTLFDEEKFLFTQNLLLGSLRVRDRLANLEKHTADFQSLMQEYISGDIDYYRSFVPKKTSYENFVLIGNSLNVWRYLLELPLNGTVELKAKEFYKLYDEITKNSMFSLIEKYDITEEQASILLPMSMVIKELFEFTGLARVIIPDVTLADGLLSQLAENLKLTPIDQRPNFDTLSFARQVARRHYTDKEHINQVELLSLQLFDQLKSEHKLSNRYRFILQIAAILHNIGKFFTIKQDGIIAYQLIKTTDLVGLTNQEIEMIALLVRHHSDSLEELTAKKGSLTAQDHLILVKLSIILAMANSLDTGHQTKIKNITTQKKKNHIKVFLQSNQDLTLETWSFQKPAAYFEDVFGKELRLSIIPIIENNY